MYELIKNIVVKISGECNLNCPYCFEKNRMNGKGFTDWKNLYTFLRKLPLDNLMTMKFIGGEPLVATEEIIKGIKTISKVERYKETNIRYGMTTNGYESNKLLKLLDMGYVEPELVRLSWDGFGAMCKNDISTIDQLSKYGHELTVRIPLLSSNISQLAKSFKFLLESGYSVLEYYYLQDSDIYTDKDFINEFKRQLQSIMNLPYNFTFINKDTVVLSKYLHKEDMQDAIRCRHIGNQLFIDEAGNLYPCGMFSKEYSGCDKEICIGNIYDGIDKDILQKFVNDFTKIASCKCSNYHCFECPAVSYYSSGNMQKKLCQSCELKSIEHCVYTNCALNNDTNGETLKKRFHYESWRIDNSIPSNLPYMA